MQADYLETLRRMGLSEATVAYERSAWILISALHPARADAWAAEKQAMLAQPDVARLYQRLDEAQTWSVDDPRLKQLAQDMVQLSGHAQAVPIAGADELTANKQTYSLISQHGVETSPSLKRLQAMIEEQAAQVSATE
jgi:hypothetical protein